MFDQSDERNKREREWPAQAVFCTNGPLESILTACVKDQRAVEWRLLTEAGWPGRLTSRQVDAVAEHLLSFTRSLGAPVADEGAVAILEAGRYPKPRLHSRSRTTEKREESRHTHSLDGGVELESSWAIWSSASTWLTGGERGMEQGHKR